MSKRYIVVNKSVSAHCCFEATVIDTATTNSVGNPDQICECFEIEDAEKIAKALNDRE